MKAALQSEMTESEFWTTTPYLTRLHCMAAAERDRQAFKHDLYAAWHAGAFGRIKRLPNLKDILKKLDAPRERMSADQMLDQVKAWNEVLGGKVVKGGVVVQSQKAAAKMKPARDKQRAKDKRHG